MSIREELASAIARDSRYSWEAYQFVFEALELARVRKQRSFLRGRGQRRTSDPYAHHVTGRELCLCARDLALQQYGLMALPLLGQWGLNSTSDLGRVVYNLIETGDFEKTPTDSRADFDDVYDWETALRDEYVVVLDDID